MVLENVCRINNQEMRKRREETTPAVTLKVGEADCSFFFGPAIVSEPMKIILAKFQVDLGLFSM